MGDEHLFLFNPKSMRRLLLASGFAPVRLVTKNLDVSELKAKCWSGQGRKGQAQVTERSGTFRQDMENSFWLRSLKAAVNSALRLSGLGETIEVLAIKVSRAA